MSISKKQSARCVILFERKRTIAAQADGLGTVKNEQSSIINHAVVYVTVNRGLVVKAV